MAISWGSWEGSGNEMRVGIDVSWEDITHGEATATATVKYYTQNRNSWADDQSLQLSGAIDGSQSYRNSQGDGVTSLRETRTYDFDYGTNSYGSSPGTRTFTAKVSGAYNGITPSKSVTSNIPARPYGAPAAPTGAAASRTSDTSTKITWSNKSTSGKPWDKIYLHRSTNGAGYTMISNSVSGAATSYTYASAANQKNTYRVAADNTIGTSAYDYTSDIYTSPSAPSTPTNVAGTDAQRVIGWSNSGIGYSEYGTEIWVSRDGGATWALLATAASGAVSYTDAAALASQATGYRVRHKTTAGSQGTLYSAFSADSEFTAGQTMPPLAPTNLSPDDSAIFNPTTAREFTWKHNPADGSAQTAFQTQWRVVGAPSWTVLAEVLSPNSKLVAPANTFPDHSTIEWEVRTKGANAVASPWSAPAVFATVSEAVTKYPLVQDAITGRWEAMTTGFPGGSGGGASQPPVRRVLTANTVWTKPSGMTYAIVEVQAGGGPGGACSATTVANTHSFGTGGSGGGYARKQFSASELGATENVVVGSGGVSGAAGGTSSFSSLTALGGGAGTTRGPSSAGLDYSGLSAGAVGTATGGDVNISGEPGYLPWGGTQGLAISGHGGSSVLGMGAGSQSRSSGGGSAGLAAPGGYGGGGGGAVSVHAAGSAQPGGAGTPGVVIIEEHYDNGGSSALVGKPLHMRRTLLLDQSVAHNTIATVLWDHLDQSHGTPPIAYAAATGIFKVPVEGVYSLSCTLRFAANATNRRAAGIIVNGVRIVFADVPGDAQVASVTATTALFLLPTDELEFTAFQNTGSPLVLSGVGATDRNFVSVTFIA